MSESVATEPYPHEPHRPDEPPPALTAKRALAEGVVRRLSYWSAGAGLIPLPGIDFAAIVGLQIKMIRELALIYEVPFSEVRTKGIIGALVGGLLPLNAGAGISALSSVWYKTIPMVGSILGLITTPAAAAATNYALGELFIEHFESGGTLLDFDAKKMGDRFRAGVKDARLRRSTT